jgi:hypothetical protein
MGQGQGSAEINVELVGSVNAGVTWVTLGAPVPVGLADAHWANVRLNADRDVAPSEVVRYAIRVTRLSGTGTVAESRCQLRLQVSNRNPNASPDVDE